MSSHSLACCLLGLLTLASTCYIQNCPLGGKRAAVEMDICKMRGKGRCFRSSICSRNRLGCFVGAAKALHCQEESYLPLLCHLSQKPCRSQGQCVATSICYSSDGFCANPARDPNVIFSQC
uniref:Oxytocin-neurophysin 1 n=1 Tax=Sciurus vulgaris TaxID=55149 RepID=A0A8D2BAP5_SCIVU